MHSQSPTLHRQMRKQSLQKQAPAVATLVRPRMQAECWLCQRTQEWCLGCASPWMIDHSRNKQSIQEQSRWETQAKTITNSWWPRLAKLLLLLNRRVLSELLKPAEGSPLLPPFPPICSFTSCGFQLPLVKYSLEILNENFQKWTIRKL